MSSNNSDACPLDSGVPRSEPASVRGQASDTSKITPDIKKIYKDSSELYKQHTSGNVIDRVVWNTCNDPTNGYESRKLLVRSDRFPIIGDIFCPSNQSQSHQS